MATKQAGGLSPHSASSLSSRQKEGNHGPPGTLPICHASHPRLCFAESTLPGHQVGWTCAGDREVTGLCLSPGITLRHRPLVASASGVCWKLFKHRRMVTQKADKGGRHASSTPSLHAKSKLRLWPPFRTSSISPDRLPRRILTLCQVPWSRFCRSIASFSAVRSR